MSGYPSSVQHAQQRPQPVVYQQPQQPVYQQQQPVYQQQQPVVYQQQQQPVVYQQQQLQGQQVQYVQNPAQVQYVQQVQPQVVMQQQHPQPVQHQTQPVQYPQDPQQQQPIASGAAESATKARIKDACGDTKFEQFMCGISVILWLMAFIEIPALFIFATSFGGADEEGCCGIIQQQSYDIAGAECHENSITNGTIPRVTLNGSILCLIDDSTCMDYSFQIDALDDDVNASQAIEYNSLPACLEGGGYELEDLCGSQPVDEWVEIGGSSDAIRWCYIAVFIACVTNFCDVLDWCGAFKKYKCCNSTCGQATWKFFAILTWITILSATTQEVENPAANGYEGENFYIDEDAEDLIQAKVNGTFNAIDMQISGDTYASMEIPAAWYVHNVCGIEGGEGAAILWIDYDIDVPEWVLSDAYGTVAYIGIALSVSEMVLFFLWLCSRKKEDNEKNTQQAIQMS